jgi:phosphoadenosine phosphosulfate reductase
MNAPPSDVLARWNAELERMNPAEIIDWAVCQAFAGRRIAATSSFQDQSRGFLFLLSRIAPHVPVYFLDTGYHFPETLDYVRLVQRALGLDLRVVKPDPGIPDNQMYKTDPDMCCYLRKVEPLQTSFVDVDVWLSGIRRDQTANRQAASICDIHESLAAIKILPMANVSKETQRRLNERTGLPPHPLTAQGYRSIGCYPCTGIPTDPDDDRSGRWQGKPKTECGLHLPQVKKTPEGDLP